MPIHYMLSLTILQEENQKNSILFQIFSSDNLHMGTDCHAARLPRNDIVKNCPLSTVNSPYRLGGRGKRQSSGLVSTSTMSGPMRLMQPQGI